MRIPAPSVFQMQPSTRMRRRLVTSMCLMLPKDIYPCAATTAACSGGREWKKLPVFKHLDDPLFQVSSASLCPLCELKCGVGATFHGKLQTDDSDSFVFEAWDTVDDAYLTYNAKVLEDYALHEGSPNAMAFSGGCKPLPTGKGQATLVRYRGGSEGAPASLVDAGYQTAAVGQYVSARDDLRDVLVSHSDQDHASGAIEVCEKFGVRLRMAIPTGLFRDRSLVKKLADFPLRTGGSLPVHDVASLLREERGECWDSFLLIPPRDHVSQRDPNRASVSFVLRARYAKKASEAFAAAFLGDRPYELFAREYAYFFNTELRFDILSLPHHGSDVGVSLPNDDDKLPAADFVLIQGYPSDSTYERAHSHLLQRSWQAKCERVCAILVFVGSKLTEDAATRAVGQQFVDSQAIALCLKPEAVVEFLCVGVPGEERATLKLSSKSDISWVVPATFRQRTWSRSDDDSSSDWTKKKLPTPVYGPPIDIWKDLKKRVIFRASTNA